MYIGDAVRRMRVMFVLALALLGLCTSCISSKVEPGPMVSRNYAVQPFKTVKASGGVVVVVSKGHSDSIRVECCQRDIDGIRVDCKNGELDIYRASSLIYGDANFTLYLTVPEFPNLDLSGAAEVKVSQPMTGGDVSISMSGASKIAGIDLTVTSLRMELSGASESFMTLRKAQALELDLSGASDVDIELDECGYVSVEGSGATDVKLHGKARSAVTDCSGACSVNLSGLMLTGNN